MLDRALRRAAMPLAFSQGFHPMPLLSFGRALPVGVESQAEWFALTLHKDLPPQEVAARLTPLLPPGMDVLRIEPVEKSRRTEQAVAEAFTLRMPTAEETEAAARCFAEFAALPERMFTRETKKGPRTADIRLMLRNWAAQHNAAGAVEAVTFVADWGNGYLSPMLLCMAILEIMGEPETLRQRIGLLKTAQIFTDGQSYPE